MTIDMYSCRDAARETGKSLAAVRAYVRRNQLGRKVGRDYVLTAADLDILRAMRGPGRPARARNRKAEVQP